MPIQKVSGGYRWGDHGKVYPTREQAEKQAAAAYANGYTGDDAPDEDDPAQDEAYKREAIALDKSSARTYDKDKRLHVSKTPISKAAVNMYYGREIVGYHDLGLDPYKQYHMFRDPDELKKGAHTFNSVPLLIEHIPVNAEKPHKEYVVGATGTDSLFDGDYLHNSLVVWDGEAIDKVQTGTQKQLSAAYHYRADMTPGYYKGQAYDGVMRDIVGNHVALVEAGRAGADVYVVDSQPPPELAAMSKLLEELRPFLAQDADESKVAKVLKGQGERSDKNHEIIKEKEDEILKGEKKLEKGQKELKKGHKELGADEEEKDKKPKMAKDEDDDGTSDDPEITGDARAYPLAAEMCDTPIEKAITDRANRAKETYAMDSNEITKLAMDSARREFLQIRRAEAAVKPLVGEVIAMDSAEEIYGFALKSVGFDIEGVHPSAFPALIEMAKKHQSATREPVRVMALDAASIDDFQQAFPNATQLKRG